MAGKKEYTLTINGVKESIKDVTSLEAVLKSLDATMKSASTQTVNAVTASKAKASALTEEEKAAKKLEETQRRITEAQQGANDEQVRAAQALREATREQRLRIQAEEASANSIGAMRVQLAQLKDEWLGMDVGTEEFAKMSEEIKELNDRIKEAEQSTGDFRRNVGNYSSALEGLGELSQGIEGVSKSSMGLAQGLLGANSLMAMFGDQSEESAEQSRKLQKIIALLSIVQQVNTNVLKEGIVQNKLAVVTDAIRAKQIKARAAAEASATKGTVAATAAQKIFNIVASANPYVLLALALVAVGTALFAFSKRTNSAAEEQKRLNEQIEAGRKLLDDEAEYITKQSKARQDSIQREIDRLKAVADAEAVNGKISLKMLEEIRSKENALNEERKRHAQQMAEKYQDDTAALKKNQKEIESLERELKKLIAYTGRKHEVDFRIDGEKFSAKVEEAIERTQKALDDKKNSIDIALEVKAIEDSANTESVKLAEQRKKEDKERTKAAAEEAKNRTSVELAAIRAAEDARIKLLADSYEQSRATIEATYGRQIEDLRNRLATEQGLTKKAREAINATIVDTEKQLAADLDKLRKEQAEKAEALTREVEDSRTALIQGELEKQRAEINTQYDRQIADYKKRLETDKTLTEEQQAQITELITNAETARAAAVEKITAEHLSRQADQQLSALDSLLQSAQDRAEAVTKDGETGLINVKATRKGLEEANKTIGEYIQGLQVYQSEAAAAHKRTLATLQEGTAEYEAETLRYAAVTEDVARRVKEAQDEMAENSKKSADVQFDAIQRVLDKVAEYADLAASAVSSVMETWNMGLQMQLDDINVKLDDVNSRYDEAKKLRESAVNDVEKLEEKLQSATGRTARVLKAQLETATKARKEAAKEEDKLRKEKERLEEEAAKKEKQIKRNELTAQIAQGVANTALGVTKAWSLGPILGPVMAAFVGIMGGIQVGLIAKQLSKLADGGEISGPSHAQGGVVVNVGGTPSYEAEGGEFVVNKASYAANKALVNFINDTPRAVTSADIAGITPGEGAPVVVVEAAASESDKIIDAIRGINFRPVVSVKDINDVSDDVVEVVDLSDF